MKPTYLLTWNPENWTWDSYKSDCIESQSGKRVSISWNCESKHPEFGDEVYLMKTGKQPRGIIAHGYVCGTTYEAPHYDPQKAAAGVRVDQIDVEYDYIVDTDEDVFVLQDGLNNIFPSQDWSPKSSGISIKEEYLTELRTMWEQVKAKTFDNTAAFIGLSVDIEKIVDYITKYGGKKYVKPDRAGDQAAYMTEFRDTGVAARKEFIALGEMIQNFLPGYEAGKCTGWVNQHQDAFTYFWIEYKKKYAADLPHSISMSINLHPEYDENAPVTLSFRVEAKDMSCQEEDYKYHNRIVDIPIPRGSGIYYQAKLKNGKTENYGTDSNQVNASNKAGELVKLKTVKHVDDPYTNGRSNDIIKDCVKAADSLKPFYEYILSLRGVKPTIGGELSIMVTEKINLGLNTILYGPPGTGKTYNTVVYAVAICGEDGTLEEVQKWANDDYKAVKDRYEQLKKEGRIAFTTFHQSYGYEEFIEGIRPIMPRDGEQENEGQLRYKVTPGVFKKFCDKAKTRIVQKDSNTIIRDGARVWNVHLGENYSTELREQCFQEGSIRIGWENSPEIITLDTEDLSRNTRSTLLYFQDEMEEGDIVVSFRTVRTIDGIGVITGPCEFDATNKKYPRKRSVKWLTFGQEMNVYEFNGNTRLDINTVRPTYIKLEDILKLAGDTSVATVEKETRPFVFIIDEINRGNMSKIFGELITLIEDTKRLGKDEAASAVLPYSNEEFSVPANVYILGTMNTADRSIALMDTALRRRFDFIEMMPKENLLKGVKVSEAGQSVDIGEMLDVMNKRIEFLFDREHTIGHAFFMKLKTNARERTVETLASIFKKSVIPLLQEYFYEDYEKIRLVLGDTGKDEKYQFITKKVIVPSTLFRGHSHLEKSEKYMINCSDDYDAFSQIESYVGIMEPAKIEE